MISCPDCQGERIVRFGRTSAGHARYRCKDCGVTFSDAPPRGLTEERKELILSAYQERMSMRGIARAFGISRNTLSRLLKEKGGACPP